MQTFKEYSEALTRQQRVKRGQQMRRLSKKIARKRAIAAKRMASPEKLKKRARKLARKILTKKILKNRSVSQLSYAEREKLEIRLKKKEKAIEKISRKLLPKVKAAEKERLKRRRAATKSEE